MIGTTDRHKWYSLIPCRRKIGKAVARKSFKSVANHSWDNEDVHPYLKKRAYREIQKEFKAMCSSSSALSCSNVNSMKTFAWRKLEDELKTKGTAFLDVLMAVTKTRCPRKNRLTIILVCVCLLLKFRFSKLSVFQKMISSIACATRTSFCL